MNTTILFANAELALAAYANLNNSSLLADTQQTALKNAGLAAPEAASFASRYDVVTQFNDTPAEGGMGTSFSATVFKDTSGNLTLAIRGTLELGDFLPTDLDIASHGAGYDQIVAMYNWWIRVRHARRAASAVGASRRRVESAERNTNHAGKKRYQALTRVNRTFLIHR